VDQPQQVSEILNDLLSQPIVAVDTESNSLHAYREQVCLMQFSTPNADYLVDPLTKLDLQPFSELFASPATIKIFHAGEYDLLCLKRDYGYSFNNLFDTMLAARILGYEKISLADLIANEFGIHLDKRFQKANWGQRPLPNNLREYACHDTHYLIPLRNRLRDELIRRHLLELAEEDFQRLSQVTPNSQPHSLWERVRGAHELDGQQLAVLEELCRYRDTRARAINKPLFHILSDRALVNLADASPKNSKQLQKVEGIPRRLLERHAQGILNAVQRGLQSAPMHRKHHPRPSDAYLNRLEKLKQWRKHEAEKMNVLSDVVLPREILEEIAAQHPHTLHDLSHLMQTVPWRLTRYGEQILQLIRD
jgi:ribonuclease D